MEEKQFDAKSIIGYVLLLGIALWYFYANKPTEAELAAQKEAKAKIEAQKQAEEATQNVLTPISTPIAVSAFGFSKTLAAANGGETVLENDVLYLKVNNQGGYISEARLKDFTTYKGEDLYIIKDGTNASFGLDFST